MNPIHGMYITPTKETSLKYRYLTDCKQYKVLSVYDYNGLITVKIITDYGFITECHFNSFGNKWIIIDQEKWSNKFTNLKNKLK